MLRVNLNKRETVLVGEVMELESLAAITRSLLRRVASNKYEEQDRGWLQKKYKFHRAWHCE